jgi:hypothetical protein
MAPEMWGTSREPAKSIDFYPDAPKNLEKMMKIVRSTVTSGRVAMGAHTTRPRLAVRVARNMLALMLVCALPLETRSFAGGW